MKKLLLLLGAGTAIYLIAKSSAPKFSVEAIDAINKKVRYLFDGNLSTTGVAENTTVQGRNGYTLIAQGDANGVAFYIYKDEVLKSKPKPVLYNQTWI